MKRVVQASWAGCTQCRRHIDEMIDNGATVSELIDWINSLDLDNGDKQMLTQYAEEAYHQSVELTFY